MRLVLREEEAELPGVRSSFLERGGKGSIRMLDVASSMS